MGQKLRFAIISDLHCCHSSSKNSLTETYLLSDSLRLPYQEHPIEALNEMIEEKQLTVDYLICPGDITNRIDKQGLITGYQFLHEIKNKLKAKDLFLSVGNHDVDSYREHKEYDNAYHLLRHFTKIYPYSNQRVREFAQLNDYYWSNGFCIYKNEELLVININTCYEHLNSEDVKSIKILKNTFNKIKEELKEIKFSGFRLAVFHHHPVKISNSNLKYKDFDVIDNGDALLDVLEENDFNLIIHGHKHIPDIQQRNGMPIFCSGSFSSTLNIRDVSGFNTFHIIEINRIDKQYKGCIHTYYYSSQKGWFVFNDPYYFFPHITGFGNNENLNTIVEKIKTLSLGKNYMLFEDLLKEIPDIKFLIPEDQVKLEQLIEVEKLSFNPKLPLGPKYLENYGLR
jgi:predicted phosphodiesterase